MVQGKSRRIHHRTRTIRYSKTDRQACGSDKEGDQSYEAKRLGAYQTGVRTGGEHTDCRGRSGGLI